MNYTVVCDSNIYRSYYKEIENIKLHEERSNVTTAAYPIVMAELLSHLAEKDDTDFLVCKKAVYFLVEHCKDKEGRVHVIEDSDSQISNVLFNTIPELNKKHAHSLQITCSYIHDNFDKEWEDWILGGLVKNKIYVQDNEQKFIDEMRKHVIEYLNPNSKDWNPLEHNSVVRKKALALIGSDEFLIGLARIYVEKAATIGNIHQINNEDFQNKTLMVLEHFKTPLRLYLNVLKKVIESGLDFTKTKHKNTFWDLQIAFVIGDNIFTEEEKILFITNDGDILRAANEVGCANSIMSFSQYKEFLMRN